MRSALLAVTTGFLLATASTLAPKGAGHPKPPVSMVPPAPFVTTQSVKTTTSHENITTTSPPPLNTTTANVTTAPPTTHNTTTANVTTAPPTTHNTTTANVTTAPPTTHNTTTANTTTPSTTSAPGPKPEPTATTNITVGNYTVIDGKVLCVMVQTAIQIRVNNSQVAGSYIVPGDAKSVGRCERNTASLKIILNKGYFVSMNFVKNDTTKVVFVSAVAVNLTYAFKSGVLSHLESKNESVQLFSVATGHSYSCKSESVFLGNGTYLEFSQDRLQAFNFTNNQFGPPDLCQADQPDYRVAIGVGVVLLILIIIVVVAYLISRRRRTDGYQTL